MLQSWAGRPPDATSAKASRLDNMLALFVAIGFNADSRWGKTIVQSKGKSVAAAGA